MDIKILKKRAQAGDAEAQLRLGDYYCSGRAGNRYLGIGVDWWFKAALNGNPEAMMKVGESFIMGLGDKKGCEAGGKWLIRSFDSGCAHAAFIMAKFAMVHGRRIFNRWGACWAWGANLSPGPDYSERLSVYCLTKAAEAGDAEAQCKLGLWLLHGNHVERNEAEAIKWLTKAAETGDENARIKLDKLNAPISNNGK